MLLQWNSAAPRIMLGELGTNRSEGTSKGGIRDVVAADVGTETSVGALAMLPRLRRFGNGDTSSRTESATSTRQEISASLKAFEKLEATRAGGLEAMLAATVAASPSLLATRNAAEAFPGPEPWAVHLPLTRSVRTPPRFEMAVLSAACAAAPRNAPVSLTKSRAVPRIPPGGKDTAAGGRGAGAGGLPCAGSPAGCIMRASSQGFSPGRAGSQGLRLTGRRGPSSGSWCLPANASSMPLSVTCGPSGPL
mmetsp:Transcript_71300/g.202211  ORF Transcript_71300/g.202211 Transcript_71300/m.202211 type:complete len:250 (-) Transcript_71300:319-1068(-)